MIRANYLSAKACQLIRQCLIVNITISFQFSSKQKFCLEPPAPQNVNVSTVNSTSLTLSFSFPTNKSVAQCSYFGIEWSDRTNKSSHNGSFSVDCTGLSDNNGFISVPLLGLYSDNEYLVSVYTVVSQETLIERSYPTNDSACTCKLLSEKFIAEIFI